MAHHRVNKNNYKISLMQKPKKVEALAESVCDKKKKRQYMTPSKRARIRKKNNKISQISKHLNQIALIKEYKETTYFENDLSQIRIYTDASFSIEENVGVTSFIITNDDEKIYSQSRILHYGNGSTFAELVAIDRALEYVQSNISSNQTIEVYTDSKMSVNILQDKVKIKPSKHQYIQVVENIKNHGEAQFSHIRSHTKKHGLHSDFNKQADCLCKNHLREVVETQKIYNSNFSFLHPLITE